VGKMSSSYLFSLAIILAFFLTWQTSFAQNEDSENIEVEMEDAVSTQEKAPSDDSEKKQVNLEEQISLKTTAGDEKILAPLKQMHSGVSAKDVVCKEGLELIFKASDGSAACVMPSTVSKLIERGWAA
jgi:hypothetical protein